MLARCPACEGFVTDIDLACVHCGTAPPKQPRRRLARFLAQTLFGTVATVMLMACYGMSSTYCDETGDCACVKDDYCSSGEYCQIPTGGTLGACTPSGSCNDDGDCPTGMHCDEERSTCTPNDAGCEDGITCGEGARCDPASGNCAPCEGAACGSCVEQPTCNVTPPTCPGGTRPAVEDGCYTAACLSEATCAAQACMLLDEAACLGSDTCDPVYTGINCTDPEGTPCTSGNSNCTCESFEFARCEPQPG